MLEHTRQRTTHSGATGLTHEFAVHEALGVQPCGNTDGGRGVHLRHRARGKVRGGEDGRGNEGRRSRGRQGGTDAHAEHAGGGRG
jgi:hypothetical protein